MSGNYYDALAVFIGILMVVLLVLLVMGILFYVFSGIGLYTMAKRRGVQAAWLAWLVPSFVVGAIADDYDERTKGKNIGFRWILLGLAIGVGILVGIGFGNTISYALEDAYYYGSYGASYLLAGSSIMTLLGTLANIAFLIFYYFALYRLYKSANPSSAVTLLVLSIFFSVIVPFVIFAQRKKDGGMPYAGQQGNAGGAAYGQYPPYQNYQNYPPYQNGQGYQSYQNYQNYQNYQAPPAGYGQQAYQPQPGAYQAPAQAQQPAQQTYTPPVQNQPENQPDPSAGKEGEGPAEE